MRSKVPLLLIEQSVMILVFALAAACCMKAFIWSEQASLDIAAKSTAVVEVQTAAELVKSCRGDLTEAARMGNWTENENAWEKHYSAEWGETEDSGVYTMTIRQVETEQHGLGRAEICLCRAGGEELFSLPVCWQEVS